jgi:hypothetical protein
MKPLVRLTRLFSRVVLSEKPLPDPEPVNAVPRPMTGFFAGLTAEQKEAALAYRGPEDHGDDALRIEHKAA